MYAQVYMHPKIVGIEETIRDVLAKRTPKSGELKISFEQHRKLNDFNFREFLHTEFGATEIETILLRRPGYNLRVASYPQGAGMDDELRKHHFSQVDTQARPMMKDSVAVFLFNSYRTESEIPAYFIQPWTKVSPIAQQFNSISYSPDIWVRKGE